MRTPVTLIGEKLSASVKISRLLVCLFILVGCVSVQPTNEEAEIAQFDYTQHQLFSERTELLTPSAIHQLTESQQDEFLRFYNNPRLRNFPPHQRLYKYLEEITNGFSYHGNTYIASEALNLSEGNCLSLAIVTTALAELVEVNIEYQLVDSMPVFELASNTIVKGVHVRTKIIDSDWQTGVGQITFIKPGKIVDYFPTGTERFVRNLPQGNYFARFYLNRAAVAIADENYDQAYWLVIESLAHDAQNSDAFNSLAVIYKQIGAVQKAEELYVYGIENFPSKLTLLKNYRVLLQEQARMKEADELLARIAALDDPSPFTWFYAAMEAYEAGDYRQAIEFYERAVKIAPYIHELNFGLAKSYFQLGHYSDSERYLQDALAGAHKKKAQSLYEAKLIALSRVK